MIRISKNQRKILEKDYGLRMHEDICPTYSKPRHYYLKETQRNINLLQKIKH